jgi:glyoxylase-like metal-dependent hydrolase (beta-lactamase superfamily II)
MEHLWGEFLHVPAAQVNILQDGDIVIVGGLSIKALDVPGHAIHHLAYLIDGACFTGDVGGVRVHDQKYITLPTPPPDLNLAQWRASILRLLAYNPRQIIPTHFGVYNDPEWHLNTLLNLITTLDSWIETKMPEIISLEELRQAYLHFEIDRARAASLKELTFDAQQTANPYTMSADGIYRYWHKFPQDTKLQENQ